MRLPTKSAFGAALFGVALGFAAAPAGAQGRAHPALTLAQADDDQVNAPGGDMPNNAAALTVRIDRLEGTIRSLTGQIEELQFQNRKLTDDLRKMQQDVDFRFQDLNRTPGTTPARPPKRSDAAPADGDAGLPQAASGVDPAAPPTATPPVKVARRSSDAFDPTTDPNAPGAPRPLGSTPPTQPLATTADTAGRSTQPPPNAPLDLMRHTTSPETVDPAPGAATIAEATPDAAPSRPAVPNPNDVASLVPGGTREEYNGILDRYKQGQFDSAATGLKSFVEKYPRDRLVPDAVYLLGEAYSKLGRHREAAEQYLRLSTDFSKAPRAPDALLRLGMSLNAMGVKEQACATYQEVTRRYPTASAELRASVDRELKRARC